MRKHLNRRSLSLVLALMLLLSQLSVTALAAESENSDFTLIQLVATDVTLDETEFEYTGSEIRPNVTVRVKDRLLTLDTDYTLEFRSNVEVGTAAVVVTGIATASETLGYTGTVEVPFYIHEKAPETPEFTLVEIKGTDVIINGTEFDYTGQLIEPAITVTVEDKTLTPGQDYAVEYVNNLVPGTGTVIIRGIATASETLGYTGEVRIDFTIRPIPEAPEERPEEKPEETPEQKPDEKPEETPGQKPDEKPEETPGQKPDETPEEKPDETPEQKPDEKPDTTEPSQPSYQITQGSGSKWYVGSSKTLSFTANADRKALTGVSINGKSLSSSYYTAEGDTRITLTNSFLRKLNPGSYTIALHFGDADASATFTVARGLDTSNPETGDSFPLYGLMALMFFSFTGLMGAGFVRYQKVCK